MQSGKLLGPAPVDGFGLRKEAEQSLVIVRREGGLKGESALGKLQPRQRRKCRKLQYGAAALFHKEKEQIVLFLETREKPTLRKFNQALRQYVPQYMLPGRLVPMEKLPHTPNDKIDRVTLRTWLEEEEP